MPSQAFQPFSSKFGHPRDRIWTGAWRLASRTTTALTELDSVVEAHASGRHASGPLLGASFQSVDEAHQAIRDMQEKERALRNRRKGAVTANSRLATVSTTLGAGLAPWLLIVASLVIHRYVAERRRSRGTQVLAMEILRSLGQAVYLADETGMVLYANPAADAMFGYEPGKLVGTEVAQLHDLSKAAGGLDLTSEIHARQATGAVWCGVLTSHQKGRASFLSSPRISALELSGKRCWLFAQSGLAPDGPRDAAAEMKLEASTPDVRAFRAAAR